MRPATSPQLTHRQHITGPDRGAKKARRSGGAYKRTMEHNGVGVTGSDPLAHLAEFFVANVDKCLGAKFGELI
jgi:hypothetical protein